AALEQAGAAQAAGDAAAGAARGVAGEAARCAALGGVPPSAARAADRQADLAELDALDIRAQRLLDAVRLFHALGAPAQAARRIAPSFLQPARRLSRGPPENHFA